MTNPDLILAAGIDAGTECVKALILDRSGAVKGRAVVPTRGYFEACATEAFGAAMDDAGASREELAGLCATGFGSAAVPGATMTLSETACHARGAFQAFKERMTVIDVGGREPRAIRVDGQGHRIDARSVRKCAVGIGSFLIFASRHLDIHPTRMQELAAAADSPAPISSYCSVFSGSEILERLREGMSRENVALGCMHSIAERIYELGDLEPPVVFTGGVPVYFPGVASELEALTGVPVQVAPDPIFAGALGAAAAVFS